MRELQVLRCCCCLPSVALLLYCAAAAAVAAGAALLLNDNRCMLHDQMHPALHAVNINAGSNCYCPVQYTDRGTENTKVVQQRNVIAIPRSMQRPAYMFGVYIYI